MSDENDLSIAYLAGYHKAKDDFENRTCENCKHLYSVVAGSIKCGSPDTTCTHVDKDFGCNKFVSTDTKSH